MTNEINNIQSKYFMNQIIPDYKVYLESEQQKATDNEV